MATLQERLNAAKKDTRPSAIGPRLPTGSLQDRLNAAKQDNGSAFPVDSWGGAGTEEKQTFSTTGTQRNALEVPLRKGGIRAITADTGSAFAGDRGSAGGGRNSVAGALETSTQNYEARLKELDEIAADLKAFEMATQYAPANQRPVKDIGGFTSSQAAREEYDRVMAKYAALLKENGRTDSNFGRNVRYALEKGGAGLGAALEGLGDAAAAVLLDRRVGKALNGISPAVNIIQQVDGLTGNKVGGAAERMLKSNPSAQRMRDIESRYAPSKAGQVAGEVAQGVGGMLPSIAANIALPGSGMAVLGVQAGGQSVQQALNEGATLEQAVNYGVLSGALEAATEMLSGGLGGLGEGVIDASIGKLIAKNGTAKVGKVLAKVMSNSLVNAVGGSLGEGVEEGIAAWLNPYLQRLTYNKDAEKATLGEVLHDAFIGVLTGSVFQGVGMAANLAAGQKNTVSGEAGSAAVGTAPAEHTAQERTDVPQGEVTAPMQNEAQRAENGAVASFSGNVAASLAQQNNARYTDTNTEVLSNGAEEVRVRNGVQRDGSAYPGGQVSAMEGSAGQAESRHDESRPADDGTDSFTYGAKVSTRALLGVDNASENRNLRVVTGGDSVHTQEARQMAKERGLDLVLFAGGNLSLTDSNGRAFEARAYIIGNKMYARADHGQFTADQLTKHEIGHDMIAKGEIDPNAVRDRIGAEQADRISQMYAEAYQGSDLTADEIWEEVICDSVADMNIFAGRSTETEAGEVLTEMGRAAENSGVVESRGPPTTDTNVGGKASREVDREFQKNFSGTVIEDRRYVKLTNGEKTAISSAILSWYAHLDDNGLVGAVSAGSYCYAFEAFSDGDVFVIDRLNHDELNIHDNAYEEETYGENRHIGGEETASDHGRTGSRLSHGPKHFSAGTASNLENDRVAGGEPGSEHGGDGKKSLGTESDSLSDITYGPDYAYWRNAMRSDSVVDPDSPRQSNATRKYLEKREKAKRISKIEKTLRSGNLNDTQKSLLRSELKELKKEFQPIKGKTSREVSFEQRIANNQTAIDYFGKTYKWDETGYILLDGSRLDFSGKHDGAPGGYRTVDHRDIRDALGYEYGGEGYSDGMVQFMAEGNIRVMPETDGLNLSVAPTKEQERLIDMFVARKRGEIMLDLDDTDGRTVASVEYPKGTRGSRVISDIRKFFEDGTIPRISEVSQFHYSRETDSLQSLSQEQQDTLSATQDAVRTTVREELERMGKEYGWIKRGENPARDIQVPKRTAKDNKVSQTVRTVLEAGATPNEALPTIEKMVADGDFSYEVYGDKKAIKDAEDFVKHRGWGDATREWFDRMKKGEVSKKNTAIGWTLYNNAVNSGDVETAIDVLDAMVEHQRNAAQALQATRILKKLSPETQLYAVQKSIRRLQQELNDRYGPKGEGAPKITIDPELAERLLTAKDQKGRDEAMKMIYRDVGRQMPSRFLDKWTAWRYLAMLGNARTHVRNVVGNAAFAPVVMAKNLTATAIESAVNRVSGGRTGRSKSLVTLGKGDRALLSAAWEDYTNVEEAAMGGGKYSDSVNTNRYIEEGRRVFGRTEQAKTKVGKAVSGTLGRAVEAGRKGNSKLLDAEDRWFSKPHYAAAMASYCKANGITAEQIRKGEGVDEARAYAMKEAQKATYRDTNAFSTAISQLGRYEGKNPVKKGISTVMEGILPFRKTPANILARGLEYSPAGIIKSLTYDLHKVKQGDMTAAELIDDLSAGLTGTGLLGLGVLLAAEGLIRGHGGDDEDKREFEELMGHQSYSLEVGGKSVTLDWLAPECLPFFVGVNLWETTQGENERVTLSAILSAVGTVTEPLLEMSCLQGLNEIFDAVGYAQSEGLSGLPSALVSAATSYLTQGVPTLLGQLERSGQGERMTTYTEKNAFLTSDMQYTLGSVSGKLPGVDYNQIAYIDAWGRTETTGSVVERAFNNMLNPAYTSGVEMSEMEEKLLRLYEATGESGVFPDRAKKYFTVNKERLDLNSAQYVSYAKRKGKTAYDMLTELTGSKEYEEMSDADKVEAVGWVYDYADAVAKAAISDYQMTGWEKKAEDAREKKGVSVLDYIRFKWYVTVVSTDGNSNTSQKEAEAALNRVRGLTREQKAYLWQTTNSSWLEKSNPFA